MKICYFGIFNPQYSRNNILIDGLRQNGHEVVLCKVDPREKRGLHKFFALYSEYKKIKDINFDQVIVGFPGHSVVWLARFLFGNRIIFDAFTSLYDSNVIDRKLYSKFSIWGIRDWILDFYSCQISHKVLLDTNEHIKFFTKSFFINNKKFIRVFVGSNERIFYPKNVANDDSMFIVHFHGSYIPLQGVDYIVKSAVILKNENIKFGFVGGNKDMQKLINEEISISKLTNIELVGQVTLENLAHEIAKSHICLGIFGNTKKALRVIPNKVFEGVAVGKAVITMRSPAILELFTEGENIILCNPADPQDLASKILLLKNNPILIKKISNASHSLFEEKLNTKSIAGQLLYDIVL